MEKEEKELNKKRGMKTFIICILLIFFVLILGLYLIYVKYYRLTPYGHNFDRRAAISSLKYFYNTAMAYFADTDATFVTSDGAPDFVPNPDVNIAGGPMNRVGTNITFTKPLGFRYKDSQLAFILKADGSYEEVKNHWIFSQKAKEDELAEILRYLPDLRNTDPLTRRIAAKELSKIKNEQIVDPMIEALQDTDASIRAIAAEALGKYSRAVEPLSVALLKDTDKNVRRKVAIALWRSKDKKIILPLSEALKKDTDNDVRKYIATALGKINDKRIIAPLVEAIKNDEKFVQEAAWDALRCQQGLFDEDTIDYLSSLLESENSELKKFAVMRLSSMEDQRVFNLLISTLEDKDSAVRSEAARGLCCIRNAMAVIPLIRLLGDESPLIKGSAAFSLGEIGDTRAVLPLVEALKNMQTMIAIPDKSGWYRSKELKAAESICGALGQLKDNRAVAILIEVFMMNLDRIERSKLASEAVGALCKIAQVHKGQKSNPGADALKGIVLNNRIEEHYRNYAEHCLKSIQ